MRLSLLTTLASSPFMLAAAKLIIDFKGGDHPSTLGVVELEGQDLGCKLTSAGNAAFIRTEKDPVTGTDALHYHRDPHFRRAEVKAMAEADNKAVEDKTYYIGYNFRLEKTHESLVIFQWKKWDKEAAPKQNIPLYVHFNSKLDLVIEYTIPGTDGSNREIVWTGPVSAGKTSHSLGFIINTNSKGKGWLEFYLDGKQQKFNAAHGGGNRLENVFLLTGDTSPKFGIYRAEAAGSSNDGTRYCPPSGVYTGEVAPDGTDRIFNSYVYRVQISDTSLEEVKEAAGL
ncbi:hypothetical protein B9Z19DRAFT_1146428 [Tuber borchii]|uniref:Uncharacterized protein n=1 Tax=Tuber borchii TaxID=42251 RepID=A0A2T6ZP77_TUBBO|nr:hypothetical protein B9Z19DRAFT_1146428 [Tuber borchii]